MERIFGQKTKLRVLNGWKTEKNGNFSDFFVILFFFFQKKSEKIGVFLKKVKNEKNR